MKFSSRIFSCIYSCLTTLVAPLGAMYLCYKKRRDPPYGKRIFELLGFYNCGFEDCIWFHTVSVGEVIAARPVIAAFIKRHPELTVVVTTTTTTGAKEANKIEGITQVFTPLDAPFAIKGFLKKFNPTHLFIMETELWPNLLRLSKHFGVKICVFNARMPEHTCVSYEKRLTLVKDLISSNIDGVICQTQDDADRFKRIGVASENIKVASSLKYDLHPNEELFASSRNIKRSWNNIVLGAISTHEGEEEQIIESFYSLKRDYKNLRLILVPRHLSGVTRAKEFLDQIHGSYELRTVANRDLSNFNADVLIGNTMGEIEFYLGLCDLIFMGGSLVDRGGHNPLEPAYFSLPIITGPYYYNFNEQYERLIDQRGAYVANDYRRLCAVCKMFFDNNELMLTTGMQAMDVQQSGRGALERTLDFLELQMNKPMFEQRPEDRMQE